MGLCPYKVPIPGGWQSLTLGASPLLTVLSREEMVKGFAHPLLGLLHCWETKGIFLVLMTPLTICLLLPILFARVSRLLPPFPVTTSTSPPATAEFALPSPVFLGTISAQERRKREVERRAKLGGKGPTGVFKSIMGCICPPHSPRHFQALRRAGLCRSGWQKPFGAGGVKTHGACCNLHLGCEQISSGRCRSLPPSLLSSRLTCSPSLSPPVFFFCPDIINVNQMLCAQLLASRNRFVCGLSFSLDRDGAKL